MKSACVRSCVSLIVRSYEHIVKQKLNPKISHVYCAAFLLNFVR